jgi:hypothetical protein
MLALDHGVTIVGCGCGTTTDYIVVQGKGAA